MMNARLISPSLLPPPPLLRYVEILFQFAAVRLLFQAPAAFQRFIFIIHLYVALKVVLIKSTRKRERKVGRGEGRRLKLWK